VESDANDEESERTENTQNEVANNEQSEQIMAEEVADNGESVQSEDTQNESENSFLDSLGYAQVVVVDSNGSRADVAMYEKTNGVWNQILSTSGYVGSQGVGEASEYTTRTPQGVYSLTFPFGVKSNPGTSLSYLQVDDNDYWVDDTDSAFYNKYVRTDSPYTEWNSAEHLIEEPVAYAYALFIGYNTQGAYGKGSCFFLHCSTGAPTAGCVAIPQEDMIFILQNIGTDCGIAIY
jgi:L,D-peptidoglycan transpeptidase YkuD (ErfK/YbiS/YcfS/YnhG family)